MFTTFKYELDHSCLIRIKLFTFYYQASQCHLTHYALPSISFQKPIFLCVFAQLIFACQWNFKGSFLVLKIVFKKLFEDRKHVNWPQVNIQFVLTSFHAILWRSMIKLVLYENCLDIGHSFYNQVSILCKKILLASFLQILLNYFSFFHSNNSIDIFQI